MTDRDFVIPLDRLPEGFARQIDHPPETPATPRAAATIVLLRDGASGLEVLLMRRNRSAGFVPGAYVFPGGRVDATDAAIDGTALADGLTESSAADRLSLHDADPPAIAYYMAALRESFEETGLLVARSNTGVHPPTAAEDSSVDELRRRLMDDEVTFAEVLESSRLRIDGGAIEYIAHWITPKPEPRRYDTRFFAAKVPAGSTPIVDPREMTDAMWITPSAALDRLDAGRLPMVFPTIKTIEQLTAFSGADEALAHFAASRVRTILPTLVMTPTGVGLDLGDDD